MKTKQATQATAATFTFTTVKKHLVDYAKAEAAFDDIRHVLMNDIAIAWNAAPQAKRIVSVFRAEFTAAAAEVGYSESWAKKVLAATDFLRVRNLRSDKDTTRTSKPSKDVVSASSILWEVKRAKLAKADLIKLIADLTKLL